MSFVCFIVTAVVSGILWAVAPGQIDQNGMISVDGVTAIPYLLVLLAYVAVSAWVGICLGIKRYHDLDKSGAWLLVAFIPVIGGLIYFVQAGCLRGTVGANRYGADPLLTSV